MMRMNSYTSDRWKSSLWRRDTRYYTIELRQNLFGEWIVVRSWGDLGSKRGRQLEQVCDNIKSAELVFKKAEKRRITRKYQLVIKDLSSEIN
ncbi:MAG: WGR domain-containing protein [Waterburya sp.]